MNRKKAIANPTSELIEVDKAIQSMRDSGFDLATAVGEVVDNSYEARSTIVRIRTFEDETIISTSSKRKKTKATKIIDRIAFADNGIGIEYETLPKVLKLGFSTRYNQREGLGRFGVGMKLAAISQAKRVDIYTQPQGSKEFYHAYLDLDLIAEGKQTQIKAEKVEGYPSEYADLMKHPKTDETFDSGALVIWSKVDRLINGGMYGSAIQQRLQNLSKFLSRAYRKYIDNGFFIELNKKEIILHDPLFLLYNPHVVKNFGEDLRAIIKDEDCLNIDGQNVNITVTLYPQEFRKIKGIGGLPERDKRFTGLYVHENEGHISILRNGREIYYDIVPKLLPSGVKDLDRFIGVEVSFPATLDEYFQVRHVKRGAEPVEKLRQDLRQSLQHSVGIARKNIRALWSQIKQDEEKQQGLLFHQESENAVQRAEINSPPGKAGMNLSQQEQDKIVLNLLEDLGIDPQKDVKTVKEIKQKLEKLPVTFVDAGYPGKDLFDIEHFNGRAIIKMNHRHLFIREIYDPLKELTKIDPEDIEPQEAINLAMKAQLGLEVLFMAYASAENRHHDPEKAFGDLRNDWSRKAYEYIREVLRDSI